MKATDKVIVKMTPAEYEKYRQWKAAQTAEYWQRMIERAAAALAAAVNAGDGFVKETT